MDGRVKALTRWTTFGSVARSALPRKNFRPVAILQIEISL